MLSEEEQLIAKLARLGFRNEILREGLEEMKSVFGEKHVEVVYLRERNEELGWASKALVDIHAEQKQEIKRLEFLMCEGKDTMKQQREEIEGLHEQLDELGKRVQDNEDRFNAPCAHALEKLWEDIMPENYGDWDYPGQAYRHLRAEFDDKQTHIEELEQYLREANEARVSYKGSARRRGHLIQTLQRKCTDLKEEHRIDLELFAPFITDKMIEEAWQYVADIKPVCDKCPDVMVELLSKLGIRRDEDE